MLSKLEYARLSLEFHLFFARIMKEHSLFIEAALTSKNKRLKDKARIFRVKFDELLGEALLVSTGVIGPDVAASDEIITPYTLNAELSNNFYTGIPLNTEITQIETAMIGNIKMSFTPRLEDKVFVINQNAIVLTAALANFKRRLLEDVLSCKVFISMYPSLIQHTIEEAKQYIKAIQMLQRHEYNESAFDILDQEIFWNERMSEHAEFAKGLLDPVERDMIVASEMFVKDFQMAAQEAKSAKDEIIMLEKVTKKSMELTRNIIDFTSRGAKELLEQKIKTVTLPLFADHTLREANHYYRLLKMYKGQTI